MNDDSSIHPSIHPSIHLKYSPLCSVSCLIFLRVISFQSPVCSSLACLTPSVVIFPLSCYCIILPCRYAHIPLEIPS
jgi:hypothetical protein